MLLWWRQAVYQDSQLSSTSTEDAGQPANALDVLHSILDMLCQHDTQASLAQENRLRSLEVVCLRCNTQISSGTNTYCMRTSMVVAVTQYFSWARIWCSHVVHFPHSNTRQICACSSIGMLCIFALDTNFLQRFLWRSFGESARACRGLLWGSRALKSSVSTTTACKLWRCRSLLPCKAISLQKTGRMPTRLTFFSLLTFLTEACALRLRCFSDISKPVWTVLHLFNLTISQTQPHASHQLLSSSLIADSFCDN